MNAQLALYEGLGKPEVQKHKKILRDPLSIFHSNYLNWLNIAQNSGFEANSALSYDHNIAEILYNEAVTLLKPHAKLFANPTEKLYKQILPIIKDKDTMASGLFLSALLNATDLPGIYFSPISFFAGYRLAPHKTFVAGNESKIFNFGTYSEGNLINFGYSHSMAVMAKDGINLNFGSTDYLGTQASGLLGNFGDTLIMSAKVNDGEHFNFGKFVSFAENSNGGLFINASILEIPDDEGGQMSYNADGGLHINAGRVKNMGLEGNSGILLNLGEVIRDYSTRLDKKKAKLISSDLTGVGIKSNQLLELNNLKEDPQNLVQKIMEFGWKDFRSELGKYVNNIEEILR